MKTRTWLAVLLIIFMLSSPSNAFAYRPYTEVSDQIQIQYYSPSTGEIVCWDACWHEVAHKLDYEVMNEISESDEFQDAVVNFLFTQMYTEGPRHPMTTRIFLFEGFFVDWYIFPENTGRWAGYKWGGYEELYADILDWAEGDIDKIPENLRQFYDMETAIQMYLVLPNSKGEKYERIQ